MSLLDLLLVLPMMDPDAACFWIAECAASDVGAISSGGGSVRCFLFGCDWTSSSLSLEEVEQASDSSVMVFVVFCGVFAGGFFCGRKSVWLNDRTYGTSLYIGGRADANCE